MLNRGIDLDWEICGKTTFDSHFLTAYSANLFFTIDATVETDTNKIQFKLSVYDKKNTLLSEHTDYVIESLQQLANRIYHQDISRITDSYTIVAADILEYLSPGIEDN